jgi:hypothetical protein
MSIRRSALVATLLTVCATACAVSAHADERQRRVTLVNRSHAIILMVQEANAGQDDWTGNLLQDDLVMPGEATVLVFATYPRGCRIDMKTETNEGSVSVHHDVDVCSISQFDVTDETLLANAVKS